jgi:hypothetical protein
LRKLTLGLLVVSMLAVTTFATSVTVTKTNLQTKYGLLQNVYYETASGPGSTNPGTNTALAPSGSSGSYSVAAGTIAYLWSPSFSSATSIPAGKFTFDLYAVASPVTFTLDGTGSAASGGGATIVLTLTTANPNDVLYLSVVESGGFTVNTVVSSPVLTWTQRASVLFSTTRHLETWYAVWSSSGSITLTVTMSGGTNAAGVAFGITGANTASPFDSGAGIPGSASGAAGTSASATISTTNYNDFIIGALGLQGVPALTHGTGFTTILTQAATTRETSDEYQVVTSAQTNLAVGYTWTGAQDWAMVADAVVAASQPMTINVRTTTSTGVLSSTLVSSTSTTAVLSTKSGTSSVFSITAGTVPSGGYIEVILTAPSAATITIYWGSGQPTNFQLPRVLLT